MTNLGRNWKVSEGWSGKAISGYPGWFLNILADRGLTTEADIAAFLEPKYEDLFTPEVFKNMAEAVELISRAKAESWPVAVYGDYDVDGVTSTALVYSVLKKISLESVENYIPHRQDEGYGLHKEALLELKKKGIKLIVSVDCGVTSSAIIDDPELADLEFLVIDHHEITDKHLPKRAVVLHPELTVQRSDLCKLSAAGMAFYFARALQAEFPKEFLPGQEKWLLDLVALSTIADVMPLSGQNRILAKYGLMVLAKTKRIGLTELAKLASIEPGDVNAYHVGFLLAPRLNAAGRIKHAEAALNLLLTEDKGEAVKLANELNTLNLERQKLCERILAEATAEIEGSDKKDHEIFLLSNKNWPRGVVGIIAGRLAESYSKPVIVFENDGEFHHGSARSVGDFDITAALAASGEFIEKFGGHTKAAGVSVSVDKFVAFSDKILTVTQKTIKESDLVKELKIDTEIKEEEITDEAVDLIATLEPFGYGNPTPALAIYKAEVSGAKLVGAEQNHLKFQLKKSGLSAIQFNNSEKLDDKQKYDVAFNLKYNIWNNRRTIDLRVIDLKESK